MRRSQSIRVPAAVAARGAVGAAPRRCPRTCGSTSAATRAWWRSPASRVIDGRGTPAVKGQTVVIRDGRIAEVGASGKVKAPAGALVVDGTGMTLIPGHRRHARPHVLHGGGRCRRHDELHRPAALPRERRHLGAHDRHPVALCRHQPARGHRLRPDAGSAHPRHHAVPHRARRRRLDVDRGDHRSRRGASSPTGRRRVPPGSSSTPTSRAPR